MENKANNLPSASQDLIVKQNMDNKSNSVSSKPLIRFDMKRKISDQNDVENVNIEFGKPSEPSNEDIKKMDVVLDYSKKMRLDFNFWEDLQNPTNNTDENDLEIKNLRIGNYIGRRLNIRIVFKSNLRPSRSGFVLNIHGMDKNGSEIAMVNFGTDSTRRYEELKINVVYIMENFTVEPENVSYPSGTGSVLQIKLNSKTTFQLSDNDSEFPIIKFNFVSASSIQSLSYNDKVDIIGILVKDYGEEKNYRNSLFRDLAITDESKGTAYITLWGTDAANFDCKLFSILIRKGKISIVDGKNKINCFYGTLLWCNPLILETIRLEKWFNEEQAKLNSTNSVLK